MRACVRARVRALLAASCLTVQGSLRCGSSNKRAAVLFGARTQGERQALGNKMDIIDLYDYEGEMALSWFWRDDEGYAPATIMSEDSMASPAESPCVSGWLLCARLHGFIFRVRIRPHGRLSPVSLFRLFVFFTLCTRASSLALVRLCRLKLAVEEGELIFRQWLGVPDADVKPEGPPVRRPSELFPRQPAPLTPPMQSPPTWSLQETGVARKFLDALSPATRKRAANQLGLADGLPQADGDVVVKSQRLDAASDEDVVATQVDDTDDDRDEVVVQLQKPEAADKGKDMRSAADVGGQRSESSTGRVQIERPFVFPAARSQAGEVDGEVVAKSQKLATASGQAAIETRTDDTDDKAAMNLQRSEATGEEVVFQSQKEAADKAQNLWLVSDVGGQRSESSAGRVKIERPLIFPAARSQAGSSTHFFVFFSSSRLVPTHCCISTFCMSGGFEVGAPACIIDRLLTSSEEDDDRS